MCTPRRGHHRRVCSCSRIEPVRLDLGGNRRSSQHGAGIAVTSNREDLSVRDVNVLGEWNDAEDGIDVYDRDAMLAVDNEANDLDALHDAGEIIESFRNAAAPR